MKPQIIFTIELDAWAVPLMFGIKFDYGFANVSILCFHWDIFWKD